MIRDAFPRIILGRSRLNGIKSAILSTDIVHHLAHERGHCRNLHERSEEIISVDVYDVRDYCDNGSINNSRVN